MRNLDSIIDIIFSDNTRYNHYNSSNFLKTVTERVYMEIPINSKIFELPALALTAFKKMLKDNKPCDVLVASLYSYGKTSTYRSLDGIMRDVLSTDFCNSLWKIVVPGSPNIYYGTQGAVFNKNFQPLMMMSWIIEKHAVDNDMVKYSYNRPLLRIDPNPCVDKEDPLQRYLCGKLMTTSLGNRISYPYTYRNTDYFIPKEQNKEFNPHVKVEIDKCPFLIRKTDTPSISATNENLLKIAEQHMEELLQ